MQASYVRHYSPVFDWLNLLSLHLRQGQSFSTTISSLIMKKSPKCMEEPKALLMNHISVFFSLLGDIYCAIDEY